MITVAQNRPLQDVSGLLAKLLGHVVEREFHIVSEVFEHGGRAAWVNAPESGFQCRDGKDCVIRTGPNGVAAVDLWRRYVRLGAEEAA